MLLNWTQDKYQVWSDRSLHLRKAMRVYWRVWLSKISAQEHSTILRSFALLTFKGSFLSLFSRLLHILMSMLQTLNTAGFYRCWIIIETAWGWGLKNPGKISTHLSSIIKLLLHINSLLPWLQGLILLHITLINQFLPVKINWATSQNFTPTLFQSNLSLTCIWQTNC